MDILILTEEAHTDDVWPLGFPGSRRPHTTEERIGEANVFIRALPAAIQNRLPLIFAEPVENVVGSVVSAWPMRSLVIEKYRVTRDSRARDMAVSIQCDV